MEYIPQLNRTFHWKLVPYDFSMVFLHTIPITSRWCMLRGSVSIWMKSSNLFWFIEGQNHFGTSWHAKMSLFNPQMNRYRMFNPPHYLQASTTNFTKYGRYSSHRFIQWVFLSWVGPLWSPIGGFEYKIIELCLFTCGTCSEVVFEFDWRAI